MKAKKIISLILVLMLAMQYCAYAVVSGEKEFAKEYSLMCGLGYFDEAAMPYGDEVSGAKYSEIMKKATGFEISNYYEGVNNISALKYADAFKVLLDIMGYKTLIGGGDGYPLGYVNYALSLKMTAGIDFKAGERITYGNLARLIYNTFDVEVMKFTSDGRSITGLYTQDERTFARCILKIDSVKGQITANEVDGLNGRVGKNMLEIDGVRYERESTQEMIDWLGYYVEAYISIDGNERIVKYIEKDDNCEIFEVDAYDIIDCKDRTLRYIKPNGAEGKVTFNADADVIKNGKVLSSYNDSDFKISKGKITLLKNKSSNYDTVIIKSYKDFVVSSLDAEELVLYNEIHTTEEDWTLELDGNSVDEIIRIKDVNGKTMAFSDIKAGNVLSIAQSDRLIDIIVNNVIIDVFTINSVFYENGRTVVSSSEGEYVISEDFLEYRPDAALTLGIPFKVYVNSFGEIAYMTASSGGYTYGYLIRTLPGDGGADDCWFKVLTPENKVVTYGCADKVRIEFADGSGRAYEASDVYNAIKSYKGVISFMSDKELITKILIPLSQKDESSLALYKQYEREDALYKNWARCFHAEACVDGSTVIFALPDDETTASYEDYAAIKNTDLTNSAKYDYAGYCIGENDIYCPVITLTGYTPKLKDSTKYFAVTSISTAVNKDSEVVQQIKGNRSGEEMTYQAQFESDGKTKFQKAYSMNGTTAELNAAEGTLEVGVGDIIKCSVDTRTGLVSSCLMLYDADMPNPDYPRDNGYLAEALGNAQSETDKKYNPFTVYNGKNHYGASITGSGYRYLYGWVYKKIGSYVTVTNQNLGVEAFENSDEFYIENYPVNIFTDITNVDYSFYQKDGKVTAKKGAASQIKNYKTVSDDCSRVIVITKSNGDPFQMFILNY